MLSSSLKLRPLKKSDLKHFLRWWQDEDLINLTSGILERSEEVMVGYFLDLLNSGKDHHFIIILGRKIIGHVALLHQNKNFVEINIVIGEKKYWGKGYGTLAIKKALSIAKHLGCVAVRLEVRPDNLRAIRAYEKCGFVKKGFKKYPNNKYQPIVLKMSKSLL